ncbi:hypothetical protein UFOVP1158_9 [uncultured Caudovirales phage]|uniref:Holliday junction nuclease RuvC n=1 Tax=uncultured Caudovirales phage TaxID=2100421 RepID=A0A6J5QXR1_9CAUD|nr:hypothetical protein UFOVP1158_9 [uncultured Caudovirales phage]
MSRLAVGLDVSTLRIGWGIVTEDLEPVAHGAIFFKRGQWVTPGMRAETMEDALENFDVDLIGLEAVFVGINKLGSIRAAMALGQVESIADYLWPDSEQKVLTATQWRAACGIPQGGKEPVMEWAVNLCNKYEVGLPESQDAADAIGIAYATIVWHSG